MHRLRSLGLLIVLVLFEGLAFAGLRVAGQVEQWRVDASSVDAFWRWLDVTAPLDVAAGLLRWAGIAVVAWLGLSTALYLVAAVTRVPALVRGAGVLTLPGVRRMVEGALAVSLVAGTTMGRALPAMAHPNHAWVSPSQPVATAPAYSSETAVLPTTTTEGRVTVVEGDNLWTMAEELVAAETGRSVNDLSPSEVRPSWIALCERVRGNLESGDVNLIFPGEKLAVPVSASFAPTGASTAAVVAPAPPPVVAPPAPAPPPTIAPVTAPPVTAAPVTTAPAPPSTLAAPTTQVTETPVTEQTAKSDAVAVSAHHAGFPWNLAGGGLLCAGLLGLFGLTRRQSAQSLEAGEAMPEPPEELADVETAVAAGADHDGARFVDLGIKALSNALADMDEPPAVVGAVQGRDELTITLAWGETVPISPPLPFGGSGSRWTLAVGVEGMEEAARGGSVFLPALVEFGSTVDGESVLVDLEDPGLVSLTGEGAAEVVSAVGLFLAAPPWDAMVDLRLVGFDSAPDADHVTIVDPEALEETVAELEAQAVGRAEVVRDAGCRSLPEARTQGAAGDAWVPTVLVCPGPLPPDLASRLVGLAASADSAGVAVLVAGEIPDAPWHLRIVDGRIEVSEMGVTVAHPSRLTPDQMGMVARALEAASAPPIPAPERPPGPPGPFEVLVRVLGPITVEGMGLLGKSRARALEALVYMACHPDNPPNSDRLIAVLRHRSEDDEITPGTLHNILYFLRQALGVSSSGEPHMPALGGRASLFRLNPTVGTDLWILEEALRRAPHLPPVEVRLILHDALDLVRGRPFDHTTKGFNWIGPLERRAAGAVLDAARRLHDLALGAGDRDEARWAVEKGLLALTDNQQLHRMLMQLQADDGDLGAADDTFRRLVSQGDDDDMEVVGPETVALHRELMARAG